MEDLEFDANFIIPFRNRSNTWPTNGPEENSGSDFNRTLETCEEISSSSSFKTLIPSTTDDILLEQDENSDHQDDLSPQSQIKKNSSRRNAWGNHSYADLITQAIQQSNEKRLTLSQIYEWMVQNVDYFKDKGDSNSSAGWKNSIRHNLSLHNRFMRVQNDGAGKSSWWMINPEAKPGKGARRRASSMETKAYEKKKGRAKKKAELARQSMLAASSLPGPNSLIDHTPSPCSSISENIDAYTESPVISTGQLTNSHVQVHQNQHHQTHSHQHNQNNSPVYHTLNSGVLQQKTAQNSIYSNSNGSNCLLAQLNSPDHSFRKRTASNASSCGRLSPLDENLPSTLSPLTWNTNNANVYGQPEMETYTDQLIDITHSLSIGGSTNSGNISIVQNPNVTNSQLSTSYPNNNSYLNNNMFINNNFMNDDSMMNRSNCNKNLSTSNLNNNNNGNRCLISRLNPSKMITSNLCKPSNNNINNRNENLLNCDNNLAGSISEGSLLNSINDCFSSNNIIGNNDNQSIDSYFNNQPDYQLGGQQMINNNLSCDNNNPNDDENNNRIFSLTNLSLNSVPNNQIGIQNNYNIVRCEQPNNTTYNLVNERMYNQNSNMVYQNNLNTISNGQQNCYNPLPNDLDPNLYSQNSALDCDIESVIKKELSFDGSLDFNFDSIPHTSVTTPSNNKTISNPTAATQSWVH